MIFYQLLITIGLCNALPCAPGFTCFQESKDRIWVMQNKKTDLISFPNCASQCEHALCQSSTLYNCDTTRPIVVTNIFSAISKGLGFSCKPGNCMLDNNQRQMIVSFEGHPRSCYFPQETTSTYNCLSDLHTQSTCFNESLTAICPCKASVKAIAKTSNIAGQCLKRINYWRDLACVEHWPDCPVCGLPPMSECVDCNKCANLQARNHSAVCGAQTSQQSHMHVSTALSCAQVIDTFMMEHYKYVKQPKLCRGNCSFVLQPGTRYFSWGKNANSDSFVFNWNSCKKNICDKTCQHGACEITAQQQPRGIFMPLVGDCLINNGNCDPLTTCDDTGPNVVCGPCPAGFSGNGSVGCQDINQCLSMPCQGNTTCTNVNLTAFNYTLNNVCVCIGNDCAYIQATANLSGSEGQYICSHYASYTTGTWSTVLCDNYVQTNGTFNITLQAMVRSNRTVCRAGGYRRWHLENTNTSTVLYRSVPFTSLNVNLSLPSQLLFGLPNCVTQNGCTEVLNCGLNLVCLIAANSCFNSSTGAEIRFDSTNTSNTTCPLNNGQPVFTTCAPSPNTATCQILNNINPLMFDTQGHYICQTAEPCSLYRNSVTFRLTAVIFATETNNCQDTFTWVISNGIVSASGLTSDPRQGPTVANYTQNITFRNCNQAYLCAPCPTGYIQSGYSGCVDINECAINNGNCSEGNVCINTNGSFTCGGCISSYSGTPCTKTAYAGTIRARIVNSHTTTLIAIPTGSIILSNPPVRVDVYNTTNAAWLLSPLPYQQLDMASTLSGNVSFMVRAGSLSYFSHISLSPARLDGIGRQNINYTIGQDFFLTLYVVPRSILNTATRSATVLTWQSIDTGTVNVNLNLVFVKYHPVTFTCLQPCCTADANTGLCGTIQVMNDSQSSMGVEECYRTGTETDIGGTYSYLVYAQLIPGDPLQMKISNAQIRYWTQASVRNPVIAFNMFVNATQKADNSFNPTYWVAFCLLQGTTVTFQDLRVGGASTFSFTAPLPSNYCTQLPV